MFGKDIPLKIRGRKIKENSWKLAILRVCDLLGCWVKTWPFWKGWVKWPTQRLGIKSGHGLFESPGGGDFIDLFIFVPLKIGELFQIFQNWVIFQKVTAWISWYLDLPHTWRNWHGCWGLHRWPFQFGARFREFGGMMNDGRRVQSMEFPGSLNRW